jgi:hypothetical protein
VLVGIKHLGTKHVNRGSGMVPQSCRTQPDSDASGVFERAMLLLPQVGWMGLKSLYANVASTVESAAKDSGYNISLGSKAVASSLQQQQMQQQLQQQVQQQRYGGYGGGGFGSDSYAAGGSSSQGVGGSGYGNGVHKSASEGRAFSGSPGQHGGISGAAGRGSAGNGFAGFNDGADNGERQLVPWMWLL